MCGIAGFSGIFNKDLLNQFNDIMMHRGPDDFGSWYDEKNKIGFSHRRLSIIDLSEQAHQPMFDSDNNTVITFNGEIYNYKELRNELVDSGFQFRSTSDTEVLLNMYLKYGYKMLEKLNGIFAFCIWDKREKVLFLARDGIGVKPLYYSLNGNGFIFASELKAILQEKTIKRDIDSEAIYSYLLYLWCPAPRTPLKSIKKLPPGHALIVKDNKVVKEWQYYDLPYHLEIEHMDEYDAIINLQRTLKTAVKRQMVADVQIGAFLSGGLDSSSIVALAQETLQKKKIKCFTIGFEENQLNKNEGLLKDLPYAKKVAKHLSSDLHVIQVKSNMVNELERMIYHLDEPQGDPAPINAYFISKLAKENGIKVLLSGTGGDDIFTGYRRHYALLNEKYWKYLPKLMRKHLARFVENLHENKTITRRIKKAFRYANLEGDDRLISYFYWIHPDMIKTIFGPRLKREEEPYHFSLPMIESLQNIPGNTHPLNKMLYLEGKHFLCDHNLNYTDKMGMANGVEIRVPLLDPDLVAFAAKLPIKLKQKGRNGKWIFKRAMEQYLPKSIIYREKTGFGAPIRHWIKNELDPMVKDILSTNALKNRGLFNPKDVQNLIKMNQSGRVDCAYTIFSLLCIELWCRQFVN